MLVQLMKTNATTTAATNKMLHKGTAQYLQCTHDVNHVALECALDGVGLENTGDLSMREN